MLQSPARMQSASALHSRAGTARGKTGTMGAGVQAAAVRSTAASQTPEAAQAAEEPLRQLPFAVQSLFPMNFPSCSWTERQRRRRCRDGVADGLEEVALRALGGAAVAAAQRAGAGAAGGGRAEAGEPRDCLALLAGPALRQRAPLRGRGGPCEGGNGAFKGDKADCMRWIPGVRCPAAAPT